jgi:hypothetical protein
VPEDARLVVHRGDDDEGATDAPDEGMGAAPGALWNEDGGRAEGGRNFAPQPAGPSVRKTQPPEAERGDAYEDDVAWPKPASGDDEVPF